MGRFIKNLRLVGQSMTKTRNMIKKNLIAYLNLKIIAKFNKIVCKQLRLTT